MKGKDIQMGITKIEWTATQLPDGTTLPGFTWNPWMGCTKVGPPCDHCYAEGMMDTRYGRVRWGAGEDRVRDDRSRLAAKLTAKQPQD